MTWTDFLIDKSFDIALLVICFYVALAKKKWLKKRWRNDA